MLNYQRVNDQRLFFPWNFPTTGSTVASAAARDVAGPRHGSHIGASFVENMELKHRFTLLNLYIIYVYIYIFNYTVYISYQLEPHKAVAEVSKIGNL